MERPAILTIGHSVHPADRFVALLRRRRVARLCDVRRYPGSRRQPQFNAAPLADTLAAAGIEYEQLGETLGGRRGPGLAAYAEYMRTPAFAAGLEQLEALALRQRVAVMCAEADWRRCHRQLIADALAERGWPVHHIGPDGGLRKHPGSVLRARGEQQRLG